jgi:hypothetical protein
MSGNSAQIPLASTPHRLTPGLKKSSKAGVEGKTEAWVVKPEQKPSSLVKQTQWSQVLTQVRKTLCEHLTPELGPKCACLTTNK